ncbi:MAG: hypothetical protein D6712_20905 [Chloroflexi bacterium]|nr:MAG: hypothetical protein D6712_20905 [Chloroflexota bacterium]
MVDKRVEILLEWSLDQQKAQQTLKFHQDLNERLDKLRTRINEVKSRFDELEETAGRAAVIAASVFAPLTLAATNYVEQVGMAERTSQRWLALSQRQQQVQITLGRKAAEALLPYREILVDILELGARVDPALLQAGVAGAGILAGAATLGLFVSQIGKLYTGLLLLNTTMQQLIATQVGGMVARGVGGVTATALGVGVGIASTRAIGQVSGDERLQQVGLSDLIVYLYDILKTFVAALALGAKLIEEQFSSLRKRFELAILEIKSAFDKIPQTLQQIIDGLLLVFTDLLGEIPVVGGKAVEALGLDRQSILNRQRVSNASIVDVDAVRSILSGTGLNQATQAFLTGRIAETTSFEDLNKLLDSLEYQTFITSETAEQIRNTLVGTERERLEILRRADERQASIDQRYAFVGEILAAYDQTIRPRVERIDMPSFTSGADMFIAQLNEPLLNAFESFQQELVILENAYQEQRIDAQKNFSQAMTALEKQTQEQRLTLQQTYTQRLKALEQEQAEAQQLYNEQVLEARVNYQKEELRAQERYEQQRTRLIEQYNEQLRDAILNRDATAIVNLMRSRLRQTRDLEQGELTERQQRREQLAERLQDLETSYQKEQEAFAKQRQTIESEYRENQRKLEENIRKEQRVLQENYRQKQRDLQVSLNNEILERRKAFNRQLLELTEFQNYESEVRRAHYERLNAQLSQYLLGNLSTQLQSNARVISNAVYGRGTSTSRSTSLSVGGITVNANSVQQPERVAAMVQEKIYELFRSLVD